MNSVAGPRPAFAFALRRRSRLASALLAAALLAGCAATNDESFTTGEVDLSPIAVVVPRMKVIESAEAHADGRPTGFVYMNISDEMAPRYTAGTALVAERIPYSELRRGMTVILRRGPDRVAHLLVSHTQDGWGTRGLNAQRDEVELMTAANYLGVVVMAFSPEPEAK